MIVVNKKLDIANVPFFSTPYSFYTGHAYFDFNPCSIFTESVSYPGIFLYHWIWMGAQRSSPTYGGKDWQKILDHQAGKCILHQFSYSKSQKPFWQLSRPW